MVSLCFFLRARHRDIRRIAAALQVIAQPAQLDRGCTRCHVWHAVDTPGLLCYLEEWNTEEDLRRQLCSPRFAQLLSIMESAAGPPTLEIRFVDQVHGLDFVHEIRSGQLRSG